jgi:hypothetical protein
MRFFVSALGLALAGAVAAAAGLTPEQQRALPAPVTRPVNFATEIRPILETSCTKCHGRGHDKGGFRIDTRETLLRGGDSGPAVIPGQSAGSYLIELVSGLNPDSVMPRKGTKLTREQVSLLRAWIDQGVPWSADITFAKPSPVNLSPHQPASLVPASPDENPVDSILRGYFAAHQVKAPALVDDRTFARRVYLDVVGLLPPPEELEQFVADPGTDKRTRLVRRLLADPRGYAEHWLSFWNDLLRNDYRGTGYIDGGRKQITAWLFSALATNMPYDQFVARLIHPGAESEGFTKGIVWRGVVNASQVPEMQAAQNISQVFMGVNLKCASCHDSFINDWRLADAYGLAAVYHDGPMEMFLCDKPTGKKTDAQFIYGELGGIDPKSDKRTRTQRLAEIMTSRNNGRLSRTIVNRLWARFLGRGLIEPVDDMEQAAWSPDLLDWLAEDLFAHGYDLKQTMARILTSRAYQSASVPQAEVVRADYVFRGPGVRRLSAEQFRDALGQLTGVWHAQPAGEFDFNCLSDAGSNPLPLDGKWIWETPGAAQKAAPATMYFRKRFVLETVPTAASALVACDNSFTLYVNGTKAASGKDYTKPAWVDIRPHLRAGDNLLAVSAVNHLPDNTPPDGKKPVPADAANPAGLFVQVTLGGGANRSAVISDASWRCSTNRSKGWDQGAFHDDEWPVAAELGGVTMAPWNLDRNLSHVRTLALMKDRTRAALANADPLTVALGRPNREQVSTTRPTSATTLQALELTNGETLARLISRGAERIVEAESSPAVIIDRLYRQSLGRSPTAAERASAQALFSDKLAAKEGVEDLLWALTMLPEFQLIL